MRDDVAPTDLAIIQIMIGSVLDATRDVDPEAWRRYLAIMLRGLSARPDELGPLPVGPIANEQIPRVMTNHKLATREAPIVPPASSS
jgi:hypothetical protein